MSDALRDYLRSLDEPRGYLIGGAFDGLPVPPPEFDARCVKELRALLAAPGRATPTENENG